jgi:isopentenyl-diphosphate delta-isomerase
MSVPSDAARGAVTANRKDLHIEACLDPTVEGFATTGLAAVVLPHEALPEVDLDEIDSSVEFLGRRLRTPIMISPMTGGTERAHVINRRLAQTAQAHGMAMGLGSGRVAIEDPERARTFYVRDVAPDVFLMANLGAVQLRKGYGPGHARVLVERLRADALMLHLNPLQEAVQDGGDTQFGDLARHIAALVEALRPDGVPIIAREVGCGLSRRSARLLLDCGVAALDAGGQGGTSWAAAEGRATARGIARTVSETFSGWGIGLAQSLINVRHESPQIPLIASGGIRSGLDAARAIALGADLTSLARPFLVAADEGEGAVDALAARLTTEVRVALFCTGSRRLADLKGRALPRQP